MNYNLLGIHGKAGVGKDTLAKGLRIYHGFQRMAFADPLRQAAAAAFGVDLEWLSDPDLKNTVHPYWKITPREMMQKMGNEAMKPVFGGDFWVLRWLKDYEPIRGTSQTVVITDVRHEVEAKHIRALGGLIIHLTRPGAGLTGEGAKHSSEAGILVHDGDLQLVNDGSVADLWSKFFHAGLIREEALNGG